LMYSCISVPGRMGRWHLGWLKSFWTTGGRRTLGINENDPMEILVTDDGILARPYKQGCICCVLQKTW
ncbi:AbrB/MazE/SpoVT family DNA-binding domain-containing protein, partial [Anaerotruncus colihominis]|uniref:AbrB/MazE/SpoVT family DNA-binding domain-containing protein n=1 Tax=Anaerotruncus colihominis TaxID=169435 RepID=UPI00210D2690